MTVNPGDPNGKHISLSDGGSTIELYAVGAGKDPNPLTITRNPIDRNPLKTTSGNSTYSDFDYPYSVIAQDNFVGGRGGDQFEKDTTRYSDGLGVNAERSGKLFLGGRETYASIRSGNINLPGNMSMQELPKSEISAYKIAVKFIPATNYTVTEVALWLQKVGSVAMLAVDVYSNTTIAGVDVPGDVIGSGSILTGDSMSDTLSELLHIQITSTALTAGTKYWIVLYPAKPFAGYPLDKNHWKIGAGGSATTKILVGTDWVNSPINLYYAAMDGTTAVDGKFFEYKGAQYFVTNPSDGTASKLYINGWRGSADSNAGALPYLIDNSATWPAHTMAGMVAVFTNGPGSEEYQNWRTIIDNDVHVLAFDTPCLVEHTTSTEYVILGANLWTEITGHGLTKPVTDVVVSNNGVIYFAQGDTTNIRRARFYNNAGTWTAEYADDGTNKATYLGLIKSATGWEIWKGNNVDASGNISVAKATPTAWGTDLTFATALPLGGASSERITSLVGYVESNQAETMWIMTEGAPWYIQSGVPVRLPLREYRTVRNNKNGKAAAMGSVYLYFGMGIDIERYYNGTLDDIGPNIDEGLPTNRQGKPSCVVAYPGRVFVSIDAGTTGYSSVLSNNGGGWCEIYRAPKGKRIFSITFQPIPGTTPDRLWIRQGADMVFIPFPSETFDPTKDSSYPFRHDGALELGWMNNGLADAWKYYRKVKVFSSNLVSGKAWITLEYKLDKDTTWTAIEHLFETAPMDEQLFGSGGVNGKRIKLRVVLHSTETTYTPILKAVILDAVVVTETKFSYQFTGIVRKDDGGEDAVRQLDTWAGTASPLFMRSVIPLMDQKRVFLMSVPVTVEAVNLYDTGLEFDYRVQLILQEA